MNDYQQIQLVLSALNVLVIPLALCGVRYVVKWRAQSAEKETVKLANQEVQKKAILALLKYQLVNTGRHYIKLGHIPIDEKASLMEIGEVYHSMGGNGTGTAVLNHIMSLPIEEDECAKE